MKCIILAAGYATRLYPLTENFPKPLLEVCDKSIIDRLVDDIAQIKWAGQSIVDEFIVISNHKFIIHFRDWAATKQLPITVLDDGTITNESRLGAVRDIQFAIDTLQVCDDILVIAGDNVLDFSLDSFLTFASAKHSSCVMCHYEHELAKQQKTAIITKNKNDLITSYEEKPQNPKGDLAVPLFYILLSTDIIRIPEAIEDGCKTDAPGSFMSWLSKRTSVYAWTMTGKRYDVGDLISYERVKCIFSKY